MNQLTLTLPLEPAALRRAAAMLGGLADDIKGGPTADDLAALDTATNDIQNEHDRLANEQTEDAAPADSQDAAASTDGPADHNGVPFSPTYCGEAQDPFYSTGKRAGQWKKKRGVSDEEYDAWYARELELVRGGAASQDDTDEGGGQGAPINTGAAFGSQQQQPAAAAPPSTTGEFMGWVAEKQAAGLLTQQAIHDAYATAQITVQDLFPPNDEQTVAGRVAALYGILSAQAGA